MKRSIALLATLIALHSGSPAWAQEEPPAGEILDATTAEEEAEMDLVEPSTPARALTPAAAEAESSEIEPTLPAEPSAPAPPAEVPAAAAAAATGTQDANRGFRLGFWEIDFLAVDEEAKGSTFRLLDFRIFKLLEVGRGPAYQSFRLLEIPELFHLFATGQEGESQELRVLDVEALGFALARQVDEGADSSSQEFFKLPVLGPMVGVERSPDQPATERQTYLFLVRRDVPR